MLGDLDPAIAQLDVAFNIADMLHVRVTMSIKGRDVSAEEVKDATVGAALKKAGRDMGAKLEPLTCPEHGRGATNVRMHFDRHGAGDLKYDSCCEKLGQVIGKALG